MAQIEFFSVAAVFHYLFVCRASRIGINSHASININIGIAVKKAIAFKAVILILTFLASQASAQDIFVPPPAEIDNVVGVVAITMPDYIGSDDRIFAAAPLIHLNLGESNRYFQLIGNKIFVNVLNGDNWEFGPKVVYRFGRKTVKDVVVNNMIDVDDSVEVGAFLGYRKRFGNNPRHRMNIHIDATQDVADGHEGFVAQLSGVYWLPVARRLDIGLRGSAIYGSEDYMSSFFDVTAGDSILSSLPQYDANAGFRDVSVSVMALLHLNRAWHIGGGAEFKRLLGNAADSPVVDQRGDENQISAGVSLIYSW